jgi:hypothetical protein
MNLLLDGENSPFAFENGALPVKILAGDRVFEILAPQRTSIIFGIRDVPWAAAAFRIDNLTVQLEPNLNEWDAIAIEASGKARLIRHNTLVYELECIIPPDVPGLHSNFFYRCPKCNGHIYECAHMLVTNREQPPPSDSGADDLQACPNCGGKIQRLGPGVSFCLDCNWEHGLQPIRKEL